MNWFNKIKEIIRKYKNIDSIMKRNKQLELLLNTDIYLPLKINKSFLDKNELEIECKIAHMLIEDIIFCNNGWWYKNEGVEWREDAISFHVNCNDVFAWGCADAEELLYKDVNDLYNYYTKDPIWGSSIWCIKKRQQRPQPPVEIELEKRGYSVDKILKGEFLC